MRGAKRIIWFVHTGDCVHSQELARHRSLGPNEPEWILRGTLPECLPLRWQSMKQIARDVSELPTSS